MKAYSYARWSDPSQSDGDSERRQLEAARAYAERHGLDLDTSHIDRGLSAYKSHHRGGALGRFLESVRAGRIEAGSVLLIEDVDRLSREKTLDALDLFTELAKTVTIVTLFDGQVYTRDSMNADFSKLFLPILKMSLAHEESEKKSKRKRASWQAARREAVASKKPMTRTCPAWLCFDPVKDRYVEIRARADIVRQIFVDLTHSGKAVIASNLNAAGEPSWGPTGKNGRKPSWHASMIQKLLDNRAVLGEFQPHEIPEGSNSKRRVAVGDPIVGYYPPVIDAATYHRAKAAVRSRRATPTGGAKGRTYSNLFAGLAECGECGGPMVYRNKGSGPKGGIYLVCSGAMRKHRCANRTHYRYSHIEDSVLNTVIEVDLTEAAKIDATEKLRGDIAEARHQRSVLATRQTNAARLAVEERESEQTYRDLEREYRAELVVLDATLEQLEGDLAVSMAKPTPQGRQVALRGLREQMAAADAPTLFRLRAAFSTGLKEVVDLMVCHGEGPVDIIMLAGLKNYRFDVGVETADLTGTLPEHLLSHYVGDDPRRQRLLSKIRP